jgi:hypothetical protein
MKQCIRLTSHIAVSVSGAAKQGLFFQSRFSGYLIDNEENGRLNGAFFEKTSRQPERAADFSIVYIKPHSKTALNSSISALSAIFFSSSQEQISATWPIEHLISSSTRLRPDTPVKRS